MDFILNRYRNISVLLAVILAQLVLLAYQVKGNNDVRLIRVWAVTAVTPLARVLEGFRSSTFGFLKDYVVLVDTRAENARLVEELGRLRMENQYLKTELATADRAQALAAFEKRSPSKTIAARIIGTGTGANSKMVFVDRGTTSGVQKGMAVVTPDGIVGKVLASYPTAAQVLLITDPTFAAGVVSEKNRVPGVLKGLGRGACSVEYVEIEEKVEAGEWYYTSGDDRVFPKGLPVGRASVVRTGKLFKEIFIVPSGFQRGLEEVLVVIEGVHQPLPEGQVAAEGSYAMPPPPDEQQSAGGSGQRSDMATDADRVRRQYQRIGEAQGHQFGGPGVPNFNVRPPQQKPPAPAPAAGSPAQTPAPAAPKPAGDSQQQAAPSRP
ncbi:MAG: rod shape-determining protein MreC [Acidobacteria bacterium]|nr:rod shape-determining protein MreC [Acidobacteriota bacterium]